MFGTGMIYYGAQLAEKTAGNKLPSLGISGAFDFLPVVFGGVLLILFATLLTIGLRTRIAAFGLLSVMIIGNSFHFSLGKVDHPILLLCVLISLS